MTVRTPPNKLCRIESIQTIALCPLIHPIKYTRFPTAPKYCYDKTISSNSAWVTIDSLSLPISSFPFPSRPLVSIMHWSYCTGILADKKDVDLPTVAKLTRHPFRTRGRTSSTFMAVCSTLHVFSLSDPHWPRFYCSAYPTITILTASTLNSNVHPPRPRYFRYCSTSSLTHRLLNTAPSPTATLFFHRTTFAPNQTSYNDKSPNPFNRSTATSPKIKNLYALQRPARLVVCFATPCRRQRFYYAVLV